MERAAMMLKYAVDFIHDNCILGLLLEGPAAWDTLTLANHDPSSAADSNTLATRQIATLIVLMTQLFRFSPTRLQVLLHSVHTNVHQKLRTFVRSMHTLASAAINEYPSCLLYTSPSPRD